MDPTPMPNRPAPLALCLAAAVLAAGLAGCASSGGGAEGAGSPARITRLEQRLAADSTDREVRRDLGVAYMKARRFSEAAPHLKRAHEQAPSDPEARFYYGLNLETQGDSTGALRLYEGYTAVPLASPYRRSLHGRYRVVSRALAASELRRRIAGEDSIQADPGTVAVFPFEYTGADYRYAPLGRGLGEMILVDLTEVGRLRTVERIRLQALLDELNLAQSGAFDADTAPRSGRLLGAENVIGGTYNVFGDKLNVDVAAWRGTQLPSGLASHSDNLRNLFQLQKDIVFRLLESLRVELTPQERERIEQVPTRNLQAFLAYSRGLMEEDAARYGPALDFYNQALALDPGFSQAAEQAEAAQAVTEAQGAPGDVAVRSRTGSRAPNSGLADRQKTLGESIGALTLPGEDGRTPATESEIANSGLGDPPPPPTRGN